MKIQDRNQPRTHITVYDRKRKSQTITVVGASVAETMQRIKLAIQNQNAATVQR